MQVNPSEIRSYVNHTIKRYNIRYPLDIHSFVASLGFQIKYVDTGNCDAYTIIAKGKKLILLNQQIRAQTRINTTYKGKIPAYVWLENVDSSSFIEEEIIFYPKYNTSYILIKADRLVSIDD